MRCLITSYNDQRMDFSSLLQNAILLLPTNKRFEKRGICVVVSLKHLILHLMSRGVEERKEIVSRAATDRTLLHLFQIVSTAKSATGDIHGHVCCVTIQCLACFVSVPKIGKKIALLLDTDHLLNLLIPMVTWSGNRFGVSEIASACFSNTLLIMNNCITYMKTNAVLEVLLESQILQVIRNVVFLETVTTTTATTPTTNFQEIQEEVTCRLSSFLTQILYFGVLEAGIDWIDALFSNLMQSGLFFQSVFNFLQKNNKRTERESVALLLMALVAVMFDDNIPREMIKEHLLSMMNIHNTPTIVRCSEKILEYLAKDRQNMVLTVLSPKEISTFLVRNDPDCDMCDWCGKSNKLLLKCSQCQTAQYCNALCQKFHWNQHKDNCS